MPRRELRAPAAIATAVVACAVAAPAQGALKADYRFEGKLKSSVNGVPNLVQDGPGATGFSNEQVKGSQNGIWTWPADAGLRLNEASKALGSKSDYTIVMLVRLDDISSYRKLIHFRAPTEDDGFYAYAGGLYPYGPDPDRYTEAVFAADQWVQITLVRRKNGQIRCFVGKKLQVREPDAEKSQVVNADDSLLFLRDDEGTLNEESGGGIARLRIWSNALSDSKIKNLGV